MSMRIRLALPVLALVLTACAAPARSPANGARADGAAAPPRAAKTLTLAQQNALKAYAPWDFDNTSGGGAAFAEIHTSGLVMADAQGRLVGRLATRLPSLADGTLVVLPDGRMETTWHLHPNVRWHDGILFTAEDLLFSRQVAAHPEVPGISSAQQTHSFIERVEAIDPLTLRITWKTTYFRWDHLGHREFWPMPRHLLAQAFEGDKQAFAALPYWTTDYVNLGPFRVVDWGMGEAQVLERFDDYFLGRPLVDRIIIREIGDPNVLLANLKAGLVDVVTEKALPLDVASQLREEFRETGVATIVSRQENWRFLALQFDPALARPIELAQDVRLRRGLLLGFDRAALAEFLFPGLPGTSGDSFMGDNDPRALAVGRSYARYPYDPRRAAEELAAGGWRRAADGRVVNMAGEAIEIEVRASQTDAREVSLVADNWRQLGLAVREEVAASARARDNEYQSKYPGLEITARGTGDQIFPRFDSRLQSTAQNRWTAANRGHYANPTMDLLIDRLYRAIDEGEQGLILREMGELMAADLPAMPAYTRINFAVVGRGVRALEDYVGTRGPGNGPGLLSRSAHLWDRD